MIVEGHGIFSNVFDHRAGVDAPSIVGEMVHPMAETFAFMALRHWHVIVHLYNDIIVRTMHTLFIVEIGYLKLYGVAM